MPPFGSRQLRPQCHCRHPPLWERTWRETNRVPGSWPMAHAGILGPAYEKTKHFLTSGYVYIYTKTHAYIYIYIHTYEYYIYMCVCGIHQNGDDDDPMISMGIMMGPPINKQNWALSTYPVSRKWPELDRISDAFSSFLILNHSRMSIYWWYTGYTDDILDILMIYWFASKILCISLGFPSWKDTAPVIGWGSNTNSGLVPPVKTAMYCRIKEFFR